MDVDLRRRGRQACGPGDRPVHARFAVSPAKDCGKPMTARYRFDLAQAADDDDLRAILAATPMPGMVTVGFRRDPSYFGASVVDGRFRQMIVARDDTAGRIVAFGTRSISNRYVNGRPQPIGYLSNLRVLPEHRRGRLVGLGYTLLHKLHEDGRTPLYLTTIAQGNRTALGVLTAGRAGLPTYHLAGCYYTAVIGLTRERGRRSPRAGIEIRAAQGSDVSAILDFLQAIGPRRQFFPCYGAEDFFTADGLLRGLRCEDLLLAFCGNRLVGTLAAWDQSTFRQIVIQAYGKPLRWLRPLYNCWAGFRGRPQLPKPGSPMRCLIAALLLVGDDDPEVFGALLDAIIHARSGQSWDQLLLGMHQSDPLLPALQEYQADRYTTQVYLACWEDGEDLRRALDGRPLYLELGSL